MGLFDNDADTCRRNGWTVGTRLVGDEGYDPDFIVITAIGQSHVLAYWERKGREASTTFTCRDWSVAS